MEIVSVTGREDLALVYIAKTANGDFLEFVESLQPPKPRAEKWVLIVSTLYGCPVTCKMCDAGNYYHGRITKEGIFAQIDYMVSKRYPDSYIPSKQLKVQFARMGEPSFNMNVLQVIEEFDLYYKAPGFMPSVSTIAPLGTDKFFDELLRIKSEKTGFAGFQMQFSIHTTDFKKRDELIPVKKWDFKKISKYGDKFYKPGDRKITLNFAASYQYPVNPGVIEEYFSPDKYLIKITPLNPTYNSVKSGLKSLVNEESPGELIKLVEDFRKQNYEVLVSIGEPEENLLGSNCGQNIMTHALTDKKSGTFYTDVNEAESLAAFEQLKLKFTEKN